MYPITVSVTSSITQCFDWQRKNIISKFFIRSDALLDTLVRIDTASCRNYLGFIENSYIYITFRLQSLKIYVMCDVLMLYLHVGKLRSLTSNPTFRMSW